MPRSLQEIEQANDELQNACTTLKPATSSQKCLFFRVHACVCVKYTDIKKYTNSLQFYFFFLNDKKKRIFVPLIASSPSHFLPLLLNRESKLFFFPTIYKEEEMQIGT